MADEYVSNVTPAIELITDFAPDDLAISNLHNRAFGREPAVVQPWADRLRRHSLTWVGAFLGDEILAFVHVVWDGGIHGFLLDTAVDPNHQRAGLGRAVVIAATERARSRGCVWLHVDYEPHLVGFYRDSCGFTPTSAGLVHLQ